MEVWPRFANGQMEADKELQNRKWPKRTLFTHATSLMASTATTWLAIVSESIQSVDRRVTHITHVLRQEFGSKFTAEEKIPLIMHRTKIPLVTYDEYACELRKVGSGSANADQFYITVFESGIDTAVSSLLVLCQPGTLYDAVAQAMRVLGVAQHLARKR